MKMLQGNGFLIILVVLLALGIVGYLLNSAVLLILLLVLVVALIGLRIVGLQRGKKKD
ncbi:hypothetical protein ACFQ3L_09090 [Lacticaseibacillus jixianensis]|uniref:DUF3188 domain-containing protein n=1 Tax=Lacticaseibacillus jixianensis TaxID=2486012 RepID=A0ABW4BBL0_9LACO|nr:hypothetical protein [Lacticaseibacillus jixianensis]